MNKGKLFLGLAGASLALILSGQAFAAAVSFDNINDSHNVNAFDSRELWDVTTTSPTGPLDLEIGVTDFFANGNLGGENIQALDTLSLTINAAPGYVITKVIYNESGTRNLADGPNIAVYTGSATANGQANALGFNLFSGESDGDWNTGATFTYDASEGVESVDFIVTNSLIAFGDAEISKTAASITVETELNPVPLPPAMWLLGSAVLGLVAVRRKQT